MSARSKKLWTFDQQVLTAEERRDIMDAKVVAGHVRTLSYGDDEAKARAAKALWAFLDSL